MKALWVETYNSYVILYKKIPDSLDSLLYVEIYGVLQLIPNLKYQVKVYSRIVLSSSSSYRSGLVAYKDSNLACLK